MVEKGAIQLLPASPKDCAIECEYLLQVTATVLWVNLSDGKETIRAVLVPKVLAKVAQTNLDGELVWITGFRWLERLFIKACVYCGEHAVASSVVNGVDRLDNDEFGQLRPPQVVRGGLGWLHAVRWGG